MSDLAEFVLARIAADEARARAATQSEKWWHWPEYDPGPRSNPHQPPTAYVRAYEDPYIGRSMEWADAVHIASWDPAHVLAECEAKRRIVEGYVQAQQLMEASRPHTDSLAAMLVGAAKAFEVVVLEFAELRADHPDFDESWRL